MDFWTDKRTLVTGGDGFVGSHLVERLLRKNANVLVVGRSEFPKRLNSELTFDYIQADLRELDTCINISKNVDVVFHLASVVGGIGYNISHHADMFRLNSLLNLNMMEASRLNNVDRYQCTSSVCIYPREAALPTPETEGFVDDPEPTVYGYGWAKRMAEIQAKLYASDYDMKISIIRPTNIYGPRDNFDPLTSHVIPAFIRKMYESTDTVIIWGSGNQTRSFIYVEDVARAMMEITEKYTVADPVNIGTEEEIKINELAKMILRIFKKNLTLVFDKSRPEGQPRKFADIRKAKRVLKWEPEFSLETGLKKTIEWFKRVQS